MADDISKTSKQTIEAIDRISEKLEDFYKKSNKTTHFKSILKLTEDLNGLTSNFSELEKTLDKFGISSEESLGGIIKKSEELQKTFKTLSNTTKSMSGLKNTLDGVKKSFSLVNKEMKIRDLKELKDILGSLGDGLNTKEFGEISKTISDAFDGKNVSDFKDTLNKLGQAGFKNIKKNLKELKKDEDTFGGLSKETQEFVDKLLKVDPKNFDASQIEDYTQNISKLSNEVEILSENKFKKMAENAKKANDEIAESNKKLYAQKEYEGYFKSLQDNFNDVHSHLNRQKIDLNIGLDDDYEKNYNSFIKLKEEYEEKINGLLNERLKINKDDIEALAANDAKLAELTSKHKGLMEIQKRAQTFQEKYLNALATADMKGFVNSWVEVEDKSLNAFSRIKGVANLVSTEYPRLGKMVDSVASKFALAAGNAAKFKFGIGMISGAFTLLKAVTEIEKKTAPTFKEINSAGLLVGKSTDEIGSSMESLAHQTNNVLGLFRAAKKGAGSFALNQEEILGTVSALDKAGLASRNLENQMKPVMSSISGTKNELVGAATMVKTFSGNIGIADAEIANMMGNMAFEFNSTMGSLQENFTGITSAIQSSSMSSTRFLGILGTSTAGMSIYAEQVEDTARSIARLDKNTNLSQKGIERFTKGAAEAAQNSQLMATNMAIYLRGQKKEKAVGILDKSKSTLSGDISKLEEKKKMEGSAFSKDDEKLLGELKGQRYATEEMSKFISKGDFFNAAQFADRIGSDANLQVQSMMLEELMKQSGGNEALAKDLAKSAGMEGMMGEVLKLAPEDREKLIKGIQEGDKESIKKYEELQKNESERQKYTGEGLGKLIESIGSTTNTLLSTIAGLLTTISVMMAAMGGLSSLKNLKDIFSKGGGNYKGGGGGKGIGLVRDIAGSGRKGVGGLIDSSKNFLGNIGKSVGGGVLGKVGKSVLKKIPLVGALLGGGMAYASAKEEGDSESKAKGKGMGSTAGAIIGGAIGAFGGPLGIAAGAFIGEMAGEAIGGYIGDAMDDSKKEIPKPSQNLSPSSYKPENLGTHEKTNAMKTNEMQNKLLNQPVEISVVNNITGNDEQRTRKIVNEGIQDALKYIREGSGKA